MAERKRNVFQNGTQGLKIIPMGGVVVIEHASGGAAVCGLQEFNTAAARARGRESMGIMASDRSYFFGAFTTLIIRPGTSFIDARGNQKAINDLVASMKSAGLDLKDWAIPAVAPKKAKKKAPPAMPLQATPQQAAASALRQETPAATAATDEDLPPPRVVVELGRRRR